MLYPEKYVKNPLKTAKCFFISSSGISFANNPIFCSIYERIDLSVKIL